MGPAQRRTVEDLHLWVVLFASCSDRPAEAAALLRAGGGTVINVHRGRIMAFFESLTAAFDAALTAVEAVDCMAAGLSCGDVRVHGNELSGLPVVEAARLSSAAAPTQVLCSARCAAMAGTLGGALELTEVAPRQLKGFDEPVPAWLVQRS